MVRYHVGGARYLRCMDIKSSLVGAGAVVLVVGGLFGAAAYANSDGAPAPVVTVSPTVAAEKVAAPAVVVPEPVVTPEPVVAVPEVVVPEAPAPAQPARPAVVAPEAPTDEATFGRVDPEPVTSNGAGNADPGSLPGGVDPNPPAQVETP